MRYRGMSADGDMIHVADESSFLIGAQAVAAAVRSRLLSFRGEWWESPDEGIPLFAIVGRVSNDRLKYADAFIKERIVGTEGVSGLLAYESSIAGRARNLKIKIATVYGAVDLEVAV